MTETRDRLDRSSAEAAERVMSAVCPDAGMRREILRCLLNSIAAVERVAPEAWAVTLFEEGFRLNVGPVEALTCESSPSWPFSSGSSVAWPFTSADSGQPIIRVLTQGELPIDAHDRAEDLLEISPATYRSVSLPQHAVSLGVATPQQLAYWYGRLTDAHQRYLLQALHTPTGKIRTSTTFRRTHSPGLVAYARGFCPTPSDGQLSAAPGGDVPDDAGTIEFYEGRPISVQTTRYERDANARRASLAHHGYSCAACGFNFGAMYGPVAEHYIQVHHLNPVSSHGATAAVNPITDMRPLCANCHAVAHFRNPPYTIEEIIHFIHKE